jgi:hypothetical protein
LGIFVQKKLGSTSGEGGSVHLSMLVSILPLLLLVYVLLNVYLALGITFPQGVMMIVVLVSLLIWPLLREIGRPSNGMPALLLLGLGLLMTTYVVISRDFDSRHQRGDVLYYAIDVDQQKGYWVTSDLEADAWFGDFMGADASKGNISQFLPVYDQEILMRETGMPDIEEASLVVTSEKFINGQREISLQLQSPSNAEYINLYIPADRRIFAASVNGFDVVPPAVKADAVKRQDSSPSQNWWRWRWYGLPASGAEIVLTIEAEKSLPISVLEVNWGMPDGAPTRPKNSMPRPYTLSDSRVIFQTVEIE